MQTKLRLVSRQFGDYDSGLMVLLGKGTKRTRYTIGFDDGIRLAVKKVDSKGNAESIYTKSIAQEEMAVRIIRHGDKLHFEWKVEDVWQEVHVETLGANTPAYDGGMFVATEEVQAIRVGFDYAILIDPSAVSPLKGSLSVSEIMYNPIGGDDYEYIELINAGTANINLNRAQIDRGVIVPIRQRHSRCGRTDRCGKKPGRISVALRQDRNPVGRWPIRGASPEQRGNHCGGRC